MMSVIPTGHLFSHYVKNNSKSFGCINLGTIYVVKNILGKVCIVVFICYNNRTEKWDKRDPLEYVLSQTELF